MAALKEMSVAWPNVQTWQGHQILKEILHGELVDQNMSPIWAQNIDLGVELCWITTNSDQEF